MNTFYRWIERNKKILFSGLTLLCLIAVVTCTIVNVAVSGRMDWALFPLGAIGYAWAGLSVFLWGGRYRLPLSLVTFCALLIPMLLLFESLTPVKGWVWQIAAPVAAISFLFLGLTYALLRFGTMPFFSKLGWIVVFAMPISLVAEIASARFAGQPMPSIAWVNVLSNGGAALLLFVLGFARQQQLRGKVRAAQRRES